MHKLWPKKYKKHKNTIFLDGDEFRSLFGHDLKYTIQDRDINTIMKTKGKIIWAVIGFVIGVVISSIYWANLVDCIISGFMGK